MSHPAKLNDSAPVTPAQLSSPGLALAWSTRSFIELMLVSSVGTEMPMMVLDTRAIGARSEG